MFLYQNGVEIEKISKALGHASTEATLVYLGIEEYEVVKTLKENALEAPQKSQPSDRSTIMNIWRLSVPTNPQIECYHLMFGSMLEQIATMDQPSQQILMRMFQDRVGEMSKQYPM